MPRPLLLGHRGLRLPGEPPENTIAAFDRALAFGCDGFEFDVRRTADNREVISHDAQYSGSKLSAVPYAQVHHLALLDQVLARYAGQAFLDIEVKVPGLELRALAAIDRDRLQTGFVVSSFFPDILREVHSRNPDVPLGFICDRESRLAQWCELPVEYVIPDFSLLRRELLNNLHECGKKVMVWTVNNADDIVRFMGWGVDGIISDNPSLLVRTVVGSR